MQQKLRQEQDKTKIYSDDLSKQSAVAQKQEEQIKKLENEKSTLDQEFKSSKANTEKQVADLQNVIQNKLAEYTKNTFELNKKITSKDLRISALN